METVRLFAGYDPAEALAFSVFTHSVHRRSSVPVSVQPLMLSQFGFFRRDRDPLQSTDFAFTRFLVPYLCGFDGWALYCDGDMICRADIAELWKQRDASRVVQVVKRETQAVEQTKFLGHTQSAYPRKNWSSVVLFNCALCIRLTPEYVATASGLSLHGFEWMLNEADIGSLQPEWNHLVGVDEPNENAKIAHFTLGMPFFHGLRECEYASEWREERDAMMAYQGKGD